MMSLNTFHSWYSGTEHVRSLFHVWVLLLTYGTRQCARYAVLPTLWHCSTAPRVLVSCHGKRQSSILCSWGKEIWLPEFSVTLKRPEVFLRTWSTICVFCQQEQNGQVKGLKLKRKVATCAFKDATFTHTQSVIGALHDCAHTRCHTDHNKQTPGQDTHFWQG